MPPLERFTGVAVLSLACGRACHLDLLRRIWAIPCGVVGQGKTKSPAGIVPPSRGRHSTWAGALALAMKVRPLHFVLMYGVMLILSIPCLFVLLRIARGLEDLKNRPSNWNLKCQASCALDPLLLPKYVSLLSLFNA
jgi:hypothetical protein